MKHVCFTIDKMCPCTELNFICFVSSIVKLFYALIISCHAVVSNEFAKGAFGKIIIVNPNGTDLALCCTKGECNCSSLSDALESLQNNTRVIITSNSITLNSVVTIRNLDNIEVAPHSFHRCCVTYYISSEF